MKIRSTFIILLVYTVFSTKGTAQTTLKSPSNNYPIRYPEEPFLSNKSDNSFWFSPVQLILDYGAYPMNTSFMPLFQDSTVYLIPDTSSPNQSEYPNEWNLFGSVIQPSDELYGLQNDDGISFNRNTIYRCDSVRFPFSYIRQVNELEVDGQIREVVDTLFLHYYQTHNLDKTVKVNQSEERHAIPLRDQYDASLLAPGDVSFIDTILLSKKFQTDTILQDSIVMTYLTLAIDSAVYAVRTNSDRTSNIIGVSIAYKTMVPYSNGDTLLSFNKQIVPMTKLNVFGTLSYSYSGKRVIQTDYRNNSFVTNRLLRYGQDLGDFHGYIPTAKPFGFDKDFFFGAEFYATGCNLAVEDVHKALGVKIFPNPTKTGESMFVTVANTGPVVRISVMDVSGNTLSKNEHPINDRYEVSTRQLSKGIYFINIVTNGFSSTHKVVVSN